MSFQDDINTLYKAQILMNESLQKMHGVVEKLVENSIRHEERIVAHEERIKALVDSQLRVDRAIESLAESNAAIKKMLEIAMRPPTNGN